MRFSTFLKHSNPPQCLKYVQEKVLAKKTDEGLEIMERLHRGEVVNFDGEIYQVENARLLPGPVQHPRIPVWVGAMLPASFSQNRKGISVRHSLRRTVPLPNVAAGIQSLGGFQHVFQFLGR